MKFFIFNFFLGLAALLYGLEADAQMDYRRAIEADKVHSMLVNGRQVKGQGIIVAVIDTGVANYHPDVVKKILTGNPNPARNFHIGSTIVVDRDGHGTHVASSIVADNYGIAPEAKILNIRLADTPTPPPTPQNPFPQPGFTLDSLSKAIRYAADAGANIINLSLTAQFPTAALTNVAVDTLHSALVYAESKGALLVAAAGNGVPKDPNRPQLGNKGIDISFQPILPAAANNGWFVNSGNNRKPIKNLIVVCAVDENNLLAEFSNFSLNRVDVCAPGVGIEGANYRHSEIDRASHVHARTILKDGTSMATPIVSGVAALVWSADKQAMNATKVKDYIMRSAKMSSPMHPSLNGLSNTGSVINAYNVMSLYLLENASFLGGQ